MKMPLIVTVIMTLTLTQTLSLKSQPLTILKFQNLVLTGNLIYMKELVGKFFLFLPENLH